MFHITLHHFPAFPNLLIHMAEVAQAHGGLELVHLGIATHPDHMVLVHNPVILQTVKPVVHPFLGKRHRAALDGVKHLGGMKAENTGVSELGHAFSLIPLPKGMGRIINHLQAMLFGNGPNPLHITDIAVHMDRDDGRCAFCDQGLYFVRVHGIVRRVDVAEHRRQPVAHNRMGGGRKAEGGGNHLARQLQGLDGHFQGHVPVYKQHHVPDSHVLLKLLFQLFMEIPHIRQPGAVPYGFYHLYIFFVRRKGGPGDQYLLLFIFLSVHTSFCPFCRPPCISKPAFALRCASHCLRLSLPAFTHRCASHCLRLSLPAFTRHRTSLCPMPRAVLPPHPAHHGQKPHLCQDESQYSPCRCHACGAGSQIFLIVVQLAPVKQPLLINNPLQALVNGDGMRMDIGFVRYQHGL